MGTPNDREDTVTDPLADDEGPLVVGGLPIRPGDRIGPYVFEREVGRGGMARILRATSPEGDTVALKVLRKSRFETGLARFRREFHALSRLDHPNIVNVHAYGDLHGHPYIAMEFVDGPDLHQVIRSFRSLEDGPRYKRVEQILVDLCRALAAIHRRGLVHRDLKPSNILLDKATGTCKLTDFGIVKDLQPGSTPDLSTTLVGTWAYASPEHIGGQPVDHRSDLYALGVILYAMLTGKRPFAADSMAGYLEAHRDRTPVPASQVRKSVPAHLDEICMRLLQKRPRDRFQSAQEILYRLEVDDDETTHDGAEAWVPTLVGHADVRGALEDAVAGLTSGRGGTVRLLGDEGTGKSRMLAHVAERARMLGLPLHHHQHHPDGSAFEVAVRIAREVARDVPPEKAEALRQIDMAWSEGSVLRGDNRYALYDALREGLLAATENAPRVILIDDLHAARPQELDVLRFLARSVAETHPLLLVVATRPGADPAPATWHQGMSVTDLELGPFTRDDVVEILRSLLGSGRPAETLGDRLMSETDGNPFFVVELIRSFMAQGLFVDDDGRWRLAVDPRELAEGHIEIPPGIRQLLRTRLDALSTGDRSLLEVLAIAGRPTDLDLLLAVVDEGEEMVLDRVDRLLASGLVRERRQDEQVELDVVHQQLTDLVVRDLPSARRTALHRGLAEALEEVVGDSPEVLGLVGAHLRHAGEAGAAYEALLGAARRQLERSLHDEALRLVEDAEEVDLSARADLGDAAYAKLRTDALAIRAAVLQHRGQWVDAARVYRDLIAHADDLDDRRAAVDARVGLSHALRRSLDADGALTAAQQALRAARTLHYRRGVAEALHALSGIAWSEGDMEQCEAHADEGLLITQGPTLASQRALLLMSRAAAQATRGHLGSAVTGTREAASLFGELRMLPLRVIALANLAELHTWQGESEAAWVHANEAVEIARHLGASLGQGAALRARGCAALDLGRYDDAHDDLLAARRITLRLGVEEEILASGVALVRLCMERSDCDGALTHGSEVLDMTRGRDPERYLPLLQALLARALARRNTSVAWTLVQAVEDALPTLPTPRGLQVQLALAWTWRALGDDAKATEHARALLANSAARSFRLLSLEARMLLAATTSGDEARKHRRLGAELAREYTASLPITTSEDVRRRPLFRYFDGPS